MKDRAEMKALLDQFREAMARENEALVYDKTARERIGEMIGRSTRPDGNVFAYLRRKASPR